jgi:hypothetical protein
MTMRNKNKNDCAFITLITPDRLGTDVMWPALGCYAWSLGDLWKQRDIHLNTREEYARAPNASRIVNVVMI